MTKYRCFFITHKIKLTVYRLHAEMLYNIRNKKGGTFMKKVLSAVMVIFAVLALSSCGQSYEEQQLEADVCAKQVYTALESAINNDPNLYLGDVYEICNTENGSTTISFDGVNLIDLSPSLGKKFTGYFFAFIDSYNRTVELAVWSDDKIDIESYDSLNYSSKEYFDETGHIIGYYGYLQ